MEPLIFDLDDSKIDGPKPVPVLTPEGNWFVSVFCLVLSFLAMYDLGYLYSWSGHSVLAFIISCVVSAKWTRFSHVWGGVFVAIWVLSHLFLWFWTFLADFYGFGLF
jgi:hypothetical protein